MNNPEKALVPAPVFYEKKGDDIKIGCSAGCKIFINTSGEGDIFSEAEKYIRKTFEKYVASEADGDGFEISLCIDRKHEKFSDISKDEAYFIEINETRAFLCGIDEAGAYYAAITFAKLISERGADVFLPRCLIVDFPRFKIRGHFMENRYGSDFMTYEDWKGALDYLSEMKINTIICGIYGCWVRQYDGEFAEYMYTPFKKYPFLKTPRNIKYYSAKKRSLIYKKDVLPKMFEDDYFGEMIKYGKRKNIEVIPLFNSLGHNTLIPRMFPEISAIDEEGNLSGLGFCTNNEKTYEILFDLYDEICDKYLIPNGITSFEIGLDEIIPVLGIDKNDLQKSTSPICCCEKCKNTGFGELIISYITRIVKHLKKKGIQNVYIYHDMLFKNNLLTEENAERFKKEGIYENIVIDWWDYDGDKDKMFKGRKNEVNNIFRSVAKPITGYFHWNMPSQHNVNIYSVTEVAEKHNFEGLIGYSTFEHCYDFNYRVFAECAWRGEKADDVNMLLKKYSSIAFPECSQKAYDVLESVQSLMAGRWIDENPCMDFLEYYISSYLQPGLEYPQNYPSNAMKKIRDDEGKYISYLIEVKEKFGHLYNFFDENTSSLEGEVWKLIGAQYMTLADEFLTVYNCAGKYNNGEIDAEEFLRELERIIKLRDKTIALCENVRIEANQYTCIRDMTVTRQFICDLRDYLNNEIAKGNVPEIDIFNFEKYLSDLSYFLR